MALSERDEMILRDISNNPKGNKSKSGLKEFQKKYKVYMKEQLDSYVGKISEIDKIRREYLYYLETALRLEYAYNYKNTSIDILGRFKSETSFTTKLIHRTFKKEFDKPIDDIIGMRIIIDSTKILLPKESELYKEREKNIEILRHLSEFREKNLLQKGNLNVSRQEYFENLQKLLQAIQGTLPEEAVNLIEYYKEKEKVVAEKIDYLSINPEKRLQEEDLHIKSREFNNNADYDERKSDYEILLDDFEARIDDKIYYQTLVNQVRTLLKQSELMQKFGVKIISEKSKVTENGYVAKFIKLDTLAGKIEMQLQTQNQYVDGVTGFASHMNYKYLPPPTPLPNDMQNKKKIEEYRNKIMPKLPEYYEVKLDDSSLMEPAVIISKESDYAALKKLYQVPKESHLKSEISKYLSDAYKHRKVLFENPDSSVESMLQSELMAFLESDNFKKLKELKENNIKEKEDEER